MKSGTKFFSFHLVSFKNISRVQSYWDFEVSLEALI
jgi:hypothetical protein